MSKKKSKKKTSVIRGSWFYRVYFGVLILAVVGIGFGCWYLWGVMSDYENTRPVYVADEALQMYLNRDFEAIYELDSATQDTLRNESRQDYINYMQSYTAGREFTCSEAFSKSEDEKVYNIQMDGQKFATLHLVHSGEVTRHGNEGWKIDSVTTVGLTAEKYTITAPNVYTVKFNGRALSTEDVEESGIKVAATGMLPSSVPDPTMVRYSALSYFGKPQIEVLDASGDVKECVVEDERTYSCDFQTDTTIKEKYESSIVKFAQKLANYTSEDLSRAGVANYIENDSPAMKTIRSFDNQWCPKHTSFEFQDMVTDNYYVYSDSCFSCTVSFRYILHYAKAEDNIYDTNYTLYFHKTRKGVLLYNFKIN